MPTILHDFDNAYPSGRWALRRGLKLILYAVSKKLSFLRSSCSDVYAENLEYAKTLAQLDQLLGIDSTFGINMTVSHAWPSLASELRELGVGVVVDHWHFSKDDVRWIPDLPVKREDWFFDQDYASGKRDRPTGEYAVFHCDYPHLIFAYIDFLAKEKKRH